MRFPLGELDFFCQELQVSASEMKALVSKESSLVRANGTRQKRNKSKKTQQDADGRKVRTELVRTKQGYPKPLKVTRKSPTPDGQRGSKMRPHRNRASTKFS